jgi:Na+/proline symporter
MLADAITDVIQGLLLAVGLVILLIAVLPHVGGGPNQIAFDPARVNLLPPHESGLAILERWAIPVAGSVIATELVGRVLAARSPLVARRSALLAGGMYIALGAIPLLIGVIGPQIAPNLADGEQLLPYIARNVLPGALYVVFAGALISAILSTVDSTLLVSSALLSHNIVMPLLRITDERTKVLVARAGVLTFGVGAYFFARGASGVFELVEEASAFGSAGALVTVAFGLFTTWGGGRTAIATLAAGVGSYVAASVIGSETPFLLSLVASLGCYLVGAALERQPATA